MKHVLSLFAFLFALHLFAETELVDGIEWTYEISNGKAILTSHAISRSTKGEIRIPDRLGDCPVTSIAGLAFDQCLSLTSLMFPESITLLEAQAFFDCRSLKSMVFRGDVPEVRGYTSLASLLSGCQITFPKKYGAKWEVAMRSWVRSAAFLDLLLPEHVHVVAQAETPTPKTLKVTYTVKSELPSVKVRVVAWKDGERSFANIVPVRTGEGIPHGEGVSTNEEHTFVWDVASDWATDLDKVAVEILVQEGTLLPQELMTIPATKTHKAMTITRNTLAKPRLFDALVWCVMEGDERLSVTDGVVSVDGTKIAEGTSLGNATVLLNYLYGKMGYKGLAGEDLEYAKHATRLNFAGGFNQVSVKIEEGE